MRAKVEYPQPKGVYVEAKMSVQLSNVGTSFQFSTKEVVRPKTANWWTRNSLFRFHWVSFRSLTILMSIPIDDFTTLHSVFGFWSLVDNVSSKKAPSSDSSDQVVCVSKP